MKRKVVNALLLGMAITLTTPAISYAAEPDDTVESAQDTGETIDTGEDVLSSQTMEQTGEDNGGTDTGSGYSEDPDTTSDTTTGGTGDGTGSGTGNNNGTGDGSATGSDTSGESGTNTDALQDVPYATRLGEVSTAMKDLEFVENKDEFIAAFDLFCMEHSSEFEKLDDFLDEYVKTVKKTADKINVLKCFGTVYGTEMDTYATAYVRKVIEDNTTVNQDLKNVSLTLLDTANGQKDIWDTYDGWVEDYPEPEENTAFVDPSNPGTGDGGSGDSGTGDNGSGDGGTGDGGSGDGNTGDNTNPDDGNEEPKAPANAESAVKELEALDYSDLSTDMQPEAQKLIADAITSIGNCTTETEVTAIVEETKAKIIELKELDIQNIRIEVAVNELEQFKNGLTFANETDRQSATTAYETYVEMLKKTTTEAEITEIVNLAKKNLQEIADGTGGVLEDAQKAALEELTSLKNAVSDSQTASRTYALWEGKINACVNKAEVDKYLAGGKDSLKKLKEASSVSTYSTFLESLRLLCAGDEDTALLEHIKSGLKSDSQVDMVSDFLMALEKGTTDSFKTELLGKLEDLKGSMPSSLTEQAAKIMNDAKDAMARTNSKKDAYVVYESTTTDFKELNSTGEALAKKIEENLAALDTITKLDTNEAKEIIRVYKEKISAAKTVEDADKLLDEAEEKLKNLEKADEEAKKLTAAKESAYKQLESLLSGVTDSKLKADIQKVISDTKSEIAIADTVDEIAGKLEDAAKKVADLKKKYADETALKAAKDKAITQIDAFLNSVKDADLKSQLSKLVESAKTDVNNAKDTKAITDVLNKFKEDATELTKEYTADKTLTAKKTSTVKKITDYTNGKEMTDEMYSLYTKAKDDVMAAKSSSEIDTIYTDFVKEFNEMAMASLRNSYEQKLNDLLNSVDSSSSRYNDITAVISKARDNIASATSQALMENIYNQAKANVETLVQQSSTENDLDTIKQNAIDELRAATTLTTSTAQKVISVYSNKIQNATSESEVEQALGEGKALLQKLNEAAGVDPDDANGDGNGTLTNGSTMNKADGGANGNTTYSSTKKDDLSSGLKGDVKTGDENGMTIALSITALFAAIGAIGFLLWKKIKK